MKETIKILNIVFDFLNGCSEEELNDLLEKRAKILIQKNESSGKVHAPADIEPHFFESLEKSQSREDAYQLFQSLGFNKKQLKEIGSHYSVSFGNKQKNEKMVEMIVEAVVGAKLQHKALLNVDLNATR